MKDLSVLRTELDTDPNTYGYGNSDSTDAADALILNEVRDSIQVKRRGVAINEVFQQIDPTEMSALNASDQTYLNLLVSVGTVDFADEVGADSTFYLFVASRFPNGSDTMNNLTAAKVITKASSRAEELLGSKVTPSDVAKARMI